MTDLLDLVPAFQRQLGTYRNKEDTESKYAAFLADAVQALTLRWERDYFVSAVNESYSVIPNITQGDIRPIILMGSIIYKMAAAAGFAALTDGDFSYVPVRGVVNPIEMDRNELYDYLPKGPNLAKASSAPLRGYAFVFNKESYNTFLSGGWITDGRI